ncbi:MAG: hypothetical protein WC806_06695 [Candidatus Gracilibacteria bacterium]|jgi:hypothetical protein
MKNCRKIIFSLLFLLTLLLINKSFVFAEQFFDGGIDRGDQYTNYNTNTNIPMPATPSPPPQSSNDDDNNSQQSYTSTKTHKKPIDYSWSDEASSDIANYIIQSYKQAELKKQQEALAAQKKAEEEKKKAEAKKKLETQKWIYDFQNDPSVVGLGSNKTKIMSLKDDDPYGPKFSSKLKTAKGKYDTSFMTKDNRAKCGAWLQNKANYANQFFGLSGGAEGNFYSHQKELLMKGEPIDVNCEEAMKTTPIAKIKKPASDYYFPPKMNEEHLRTVYAQTRIDLENCSSGVQKCTPEHIENLKSIQIKAEQELVSRYSFKEVDGKWVKISE